MRSLDRGGLLSYVGVGTLYPHTTRSRMKTRLIRISVATSPRQGWAAAAAKHGPSTLLDAPTATRFDDEDWTW